MPTDGPLASQDAAPPLDDAAAIDIGPVELTVSLGRVYVHDSSETVVAAVAAPNRGIVEVFSSDQRGSWLRVATASTSLPSQTLSLPPSASGRYLLLDHSFLYPPRGAVVAPPAVDLTIVHVGTPNLPPARDAQLRIQAELRYPWVSGVDRMFLHHSQGGAKEVLRMLPGGSTSIDEVSIRGSYLPALEVARGDWAFLAHSVAIPFDGAYCTGLGASLGPIPLSIRAGETATIAGRFADTRAAVRTVTWDESDLAWAMVAETPSLSTFWSQLRVFANPPLSRYGLAEFELDEGPPDVFNCDALRSGVLTATVAFPAVHPSPWELAAESSVFVSAFTGYGSFAAVIRATDTLDLRLGPIVSPPRDLRIERRDAHESVSIFRPDPLLSWTPPALGTPTLYRVTVWYWAEGGYQTPLLEIYTDQTDLRLPPVLERQTTYNFVVDALVGPTIAAPFRRPLPYANAPNLSNLVLY